MVGRVVDSAEDISPERAELLFSQHVNDKVFSETVAVGQHKLTLEKDRDQLFLCVFKLSTDAEKPATEVSRLIFQRGKVVDVQDLTEPEGQQDVKFSDRREELAQAALKILARAKATLDPLAGMLADMSTHSSLRELADAAKSAGEV